MLAFMKCVWEAQIMLNLIMYPNIQLSFSYSSYIYICYLYVYLFKFIYGEVQFTCTIYIHTILWTLNILWRLMLQQHSLLDDWFDAGSLGCYMLLESAVDLTWVQAQDQCEQVGI